MTNCSFLYTFNVLASEKREAMEKKLRIKLEDELKELRAQQQGEEQGAQRRFPQSSETLEELRRKFAEAEERVRIVFYQTNLILLIRNSFKFYVSFIIITIINYHITFKENVS